MKPGAWCLPGLLALSLGSVYVLPKAGETAESAVRMELPGTNDGWSFDNQVASEREIKTLSPDTQFAKAICLKARKGEVNAEGYLIPDRIDLSIVLSGSDPNNSIHRPERCMPAQGHTITASGNQKLNQPDGREFQIKRLRSVQTIKSTKDGNVAANFNCLTYYFFVGHETITNDHLERTLIDMRDRLVHGVDQRWAYVSASMWYGKVPWIEKEVSETEADEKLTKFLTGFAAKQIDWSKIVER